MSLTFGVDTICTRCHGSTRNRAGITCSWCQGTGWERGARAVARNSDPATSKAAAETVNVTAGQRYVLETLRDFGPMTDEALVQKLHDLGYPISDSGGRTRRAELTGLGLVVDTGRKRRLKSQRFAAVWAAR